MSQPFAIGKINTMLLGGIAAVIVTGYVAFGNRSPESVGTVVGMLIAFALLPTGVAWVVWRLSGRNAKFGRQTFTIMMLLAVIGQINTLSRNGREIAALKELERKKQALRQDATDPLNPAAQDAAREYLDASVASLDAMAENGTAEERKFFQLLGEIARENQTRQTAWMKSIDTMNSDRVLGFAQLREPGEFETQRSLVLEYRRNTEAVRDAFAKMEVELLARMKAAGMSAKMVDLASAGMRKKQAAQKPVMDPLIAAHLLYGRTVLDILDLLEKNPDAWTWENEQLMIADDKVVDRYNELQVEQTKAMNDVNTYRQQLLQQL